MSVCTVVVSFLNLGVLTPVSPVNDASNSEDMRGIKKGKHGNICHLKLRINTEGGGGGSLKVLVVIRNIL